MKNHTTPRLKSLVEYCTIDSKIYFFTRPSFAIEIDDPSRFIATVCKLMDGEKNLQQLTQALSPLFPNETPYLEKLLTTLDNEYLLEDASKNHTDLARLQ